MEIERTELKKIYKENYKACTEYICQKYRASKEESLSNYHNTIMVYITKLLWEKSIEHNKYVYFKQLSNKSKSVYSLASQEEKGIGKKFLKTIMGFTREAEISGSLLPIIFNKVKEIIPEKLNSLRIDMVDDMVKEKGQNPTKWKVPYIERKLKNKKYNLPSLESFLVFIDEGIEEKKRSKDLLNNYKAIYHFKKKQLETFLINHLKVKKAAGMLQLSDLIEEKSVLMVGKDSVLGYAFFEKIYNIKGHLFKTNENIWLKRLRENNKLLTNENVEEKGAELEEEEQVLDDTILVLFQFLGESKGMKYADVLYYFYADELRFKEIAKILDISEANARKLKQRGLNELKEYIKKKNIKPVLDTKEK